MVNKNYGNVKLPMAPIPRAKCKHIFMVASAAYLMEVIKKFFIYRVAAKAATMKWFLLEETPALRL